MGWFKRKSKVKDVEPQVPACKHKWKDFPWYYDARYNSTEKCLRFKVFGPYVCIHCKERIDRLLFEHNSYYESLEKADDFVTHFKDEYAEQMAEQVVVEDMIADMQLVDREYLRLAEALLKGPLKNPSS